MNRIRLLTLYSVTIELPLSHHCKQAMETSNFWMISVQISSVSSFLRWPIRKVLM